MEFSTVTSKGQTTIPRKIREALRIKAGDRLQGEVTEDHATIRAQLGAASLKGVLASKKGKGMTFARIREGAAEHALSQSRRNAIGKQFTRASKC